MGDEKGRYRKRDADGAAFFVYSNWQEPSRVPPVFLTTSQTKGVQMKPAKIATVMTVGICLVFPFSAALATNWVELGAGFKVDMDSIRKGTDGLVYYTFIDEEMLMDPVEAAFDCRKGVEFDLEDPDWRSNGVKVKPRSRYAAIMEIVCSRVR
jgi:hypothetical protein